MSIQSDLERGFALQQQGEFAQAEMVCRQIIAGNRRNADAWHILATVLAVQQRIDEAASAAEQAATLAPRIPQFWLTQGNIESARCDWARAQSSYERALQLRPDFAEAWFRLGLNHGVNGRLREAIAAHRNALSTAPGVADIHYQLADCLAQDGHWTEAAGAYQQAFKLDPQRRLDRRPFVDYLRSVPFDQVPEFWHAELMHFLSREDVDKTLYAGVGVRVLQTDARFREALDISHALTSDNAPGAGHLLCSGLFPMLLCDAVIYDAQIEQFLTRLRAAMLLDKSVAAKAPLDFASAIALQCFNNERAFFEADAETAALTAMAASLESTIRDGSVLQESHWREVVVYAMYRPLSGLRGIQGLTPGRETPKAILRLFERTVTEVFEEQRLRDTITSVGGINDQTSRAVRAQYEEHPYPRWLSADRVLPGRVADWLADELPQARQSLIAAVVERSPTRILVAGCGTGQEPILLAAEQTDASVLAVDLSRASLAYAQRTARQMRVSNVTFCQADILELDSLQEQFDIVVCSGVLHHMKEPAAGLRQLVRRLRPHGLLKIALYSERARELVRDARQYISDRQIGSDEKSIRAFRHEVFGLDEAHPFKRLLTYRDFYSLSTCRDLLFHTQEHRYRLPQMLAMLREAGLKPLCMTALPHPARLAFNQQFPESNWQTDFARWDEFEALQPHTFLGMYHIWSALEPAHG